MGAFGQNNELGALGGVGMAAAQGFANPLTDITAGIGLTQTIASLIGLGKTPERVAPSIDPKVKAMVDEAMRMSKQGFSPEAIAKYKNDTAMNDTARFRHGTDMAGGNLASAVNAGINANDNKSSVDFAARDAALREAHTHYSDQTIKYLQSLEDKSWMQNESYRKGLEGAWGGAAKQGLSTLTGALESSAAGWKPSSTTPTNGIGGAANDYSNLGKTVDNTANQFLQENTNNASNTWNNQNGLGG